MKPTNERKSRFQNFPAAIGKNDEKLISKPKSLHAIINPPMTEQLVTPPSRVWKKIEEELDRQDKEKLKKEAFQRPVSKVFSKTKSRFTIYLAAIGATIACSVVLVVK